MICEYTPSVYGPDVYCHHLHHLHHLHHYRYTTEKALWPDRVLAWESEVASFQSRQMNWTNARMMYVLRRGWLRHDRLAANWLVPTLMMLLP